MGSFRTILIGYNLRTTKSHSHSSATIMVAQKLDEKNLGHTVVLVILGHGFTYHSEAVQDIIRQKVEVKT